MFCLTSVVQGADRLRRRLHRYCTGGLVWTCGAFSLRGLFAALVLVCFALSGDAQNLVLLHGKQSYEVEERQIQTLANFYGVGLIPVDTRSSVAMSQVARQIAAPGTLAVLATQDALVGPGAGMFREALDRPGSSTPVLIFAITEQGSADVLKAWSAGGISGCAALSDRAEPGTVHVEQSATSAGVLAGMDLSAVTAPSCRLEGAAVSSATVLSSASTNGHSSPLLACTQSQHREVCLVPHLRLFDPSFLGKPSGMEKSFSSLAPFLLFLNHAIGQYGWHLDGHYANFTIDDPWLVDPYGALDYRGLLQQMDQHNFHTTIAFIPWNYDRSREDVVALFRAHPDRYSICIHGDNHTHREFDSYTVNPLDEQTQEIRQSVARMNRFHDLTGIPYDRVMVFPHGIAPLKTFAALREYGFLGTVNSLNVPLGEPFPDSSTFLLRPYTANYAGLLSMLRSSVAVPISSADIAIQVFLGNPLLFYAHHDLFEHGIEAFNQTADRVNRMQPDTVWAGLGDIMRHTYPIRRRMDGGYDVRMLSTEIDLSNPSGSEAVFYIQAPGEILPEATATVDGVSAAFEREAGSQALRLTLQPHQTRRIRIALNNGFDPQREDIRKRSLYAYTLRRISDVRDMDMSRFPWSRDIVAAYYRDKADAWELALEHGWWLMLLCCALFGVFYLRLSRNQRRAGKADGGR